MKSFDMRFGKTLLMSGFRFCHQVESANSAKLGSHGQVSGLLFIYFFKLT